MTYIVAALYKFTALPDYADQKSALEAVCAEAGVKGTLLLASEGINGTIAGTRQGIDTVLDHIRSMPGCADLEHKESRSREMPFLRMKVRLKKEIVTMGVEGIDPNTTVGTYVAPEDWNELISDPDTVVIDTRNDYEVGIGTFEGAVNPETKAFRDFPAWFREFQKNNKKPRVAMFCTGGIRCEKSTAFLKSEGIEDVYHLKGGILKYLETVPEDQSKWDGECFVFDGRVSVGHGLKQGTYDQCFACRRPITEDDKQSPAYVKGVSCPACIDEYSDKDKARFAERQKQISLARKRGEDHLGASTQPSVKTPEAAE
ncbi:MAG: rhodanese-related sulfurtransferase [Pseudomonadota bacterium]